MSYYGVDRSQERYGVQTELERIASFRIWPKNASLCSILATYGLRYTGTLCNVTCVFCYKTTSLYSVKMDANCAQNIPTGLKQRLHERNCSFKERGTQTINHEGMRSAIIAGQRFDVTLPQNVLPRIRHTSYAKIARLMSCPCSFCVELYREDRECLQRQERFIENDRLTLSGTLHQLERISNIDVFYDIKDNRTKYSQCFVANRDNSYQCICCGFVKRDAENTDEETLCDLHAKNVPTCPLQILTKGKDYIHNKLQELASEVYETAGNPTMGMQSMMSVISQLSRDESGTIDEENVNRIMDANIRFFFANGGHYGNSDDILRILD